MKRTIYFITALLLVLLPAGIAFSQGLVDEYGPFTFDTRPIPVPFSALGLFIAGLLPLGYSLLRYFRQRRNGNL